MQQQPILEEMDVSLAELCAVSAGIFFVQEQRLKVSGNRREIILQSWRNLGLILSLSCVFTFAP